MIVTQSEFTKGLLDPQVPAPQGLQNPGGAQASKRFDVYRNNVAVSLSDALEAAFPVVRKLVGNQFCRAMAGVYLRKFPPSNPLMMHYGEHLPQFLGRFEPARSLPYLSDVARLELALRHSYHAADADPLPGEKLGALAPDALMAVRLSFAPAVRLLTSDHPIHGIYRANTGTPHTPLVQQPEAVLVTRPDFDPHLHPLDPAAARCTQALMDGKSLGVAMSDAGDTLDLGALLGLLLRERALTDLN